MKKLLIIFIITAALIVIGGSYFYFFDNTFQSEDRVTTEMIQSEVNYAPPTEDEQQSGDEKKRELSEEDSNTSEENSDEQSGNKRSVDVGIVDASQYGDEVEVRAFADDIIEGGGKCTARFTKNNQSVSASSEGYMDATTTQCGRINIDRGEFEQPGEWSLIVEYESPNYQGTSEKLNVTIK